MIFSYEDIEHISAAVTHDFLSTIPAAEQKYAVDIDALAKEYLGLMYPTGRCPRTAVYWALPLTATPRTPASSMERVLLFR